jgi:hypothetical protein
VKAEIVYFFFSKSSRTNKYYTLIIVHVPFAALSAPKNLPVCDWKNSLERVAMKLVCCLKAGVRAADVAIGCAVTYAATSMKHSSRVQDARQVAVQSSLTVKTKGVL